MSRSSAFARVIGLTRSLAPTEETDAGDGGDVVAAARKMDGQQPAAEAPALAQVTVVAAEATGDDPQVRGAVTSEAVENIEADIASLLSTLNAAGDGPGESGEPSRAADPFEDDDADTATLALLFELDRLWRADPAVGNTAAA